jgi:hypothetical protein
MTRWIRGPWWDGFWILSGLPFGIVLTGLGFFIPPVKIIVAAVLLCETAHLFSPVAMAWCNDGFRSLMRRRPLKYVWGPLAILAATTAVAYVGSFSLSDLQFNPTRFSLSVGPTTLEQFKNPFMIIVALYSLWNAYHFGMQNFGVLSIYRHKSNIDRADQRKIDLIYCCFVTWTLILIAMPALAQFVMSLDNPYLEWLPAYAAIAGIAAMIAMLRRERSLPRAIFILTDGLGLVLALQGSFWVFAIISLNHWLVATGLAGHVYANNRRRSFMVFALVLMAVGMAGFCLLFVDLGTMAINFTVTAVGLRIGLGFVHFLYDRWVYKLSDAEVRATIGRDIFGPDRAHSRV